MKRFCKFLSCKEVTVISYVYSNDSGQGLRPDIMDLSMKVMHMLGIDIYRCVLLK